MGDIATVRIKADSAKGYKIINLSDFDPKKHRLADSGEPSVLEENAEDAESKPATKRYPVRKVRS